MGKTKSQRAQFDHNFGGAYHYQSSAEKRSYNTKNSQSGGMTKSELNKLSGGTRGAGGLGGHSQSATDQLSPELDAKLEVEAR